MPLFRRGPRPVKPAQEFTVGVRQERVQVGVAEPGIIQLDGLHDYVGAVTGHAGPTAEGRDPVAVLNAKMDYAEMVDDLAAVVALAFEELVERGVVPAGEVPAAPQLPEVPQQSSTYAFIQATHARAQGRMAYLEQADAVLRRHAVAIVPPAPPEEDEMARAGRR
jgi:hypothetical protein